MSHACHRFWKCHKTLTFCSLLTRCTIPQKVVRACGAFNILTSKCASRHNSVHFFDISTSKSGPNLCVLYMLTSKCAWHHNVVHFFDISTSKGGPNLVCFVHFDRTWCVLYILTSKCASRHNSVHFFDISTSTSHPKLRCLVRFYFQCASRHNGVQLFISHLASWLRTRRFSEYFSTLRSHKSFEKHSVSRLSHLFAHLDLLSSETFSFFDLLSSSLLFSPLLFSSLLFSDSSHLCFSFVHIIVGSLTSKLPSIIILRITSITAQGGGESFKNRKPIGGVGCCESRSAERIHRWTERWLEWRIIHLSIYLSIHPSIYLSLFCVYWSICLSAHLSLCVSIHLLSSLSVFVAVHPIIHHPIFVYVSICLSFFLFPSWDLSISLSLCLSVVLRSIHLSSCLSTTNSSIRPYTTITLTSPVASTLPRHGPPKTFAYKFPRHVEVQLRYRQKQSKSARPAQCLKLDNIVYAKILRDFPYFRSWQEQKRSNSARLPYFFDGDNIKNDTILQDFLQ